MLYFLLFIVEFILLFFLSKKLVNSLAKLIFKFTRSHTAVVKILAVIFLPGTIIHELAHLLFAGITMVPVGEMSVIPEIGEKEVRLGSVQIGHSDPFRRALVGVAPVLFGLFCIAAVFLFIPLGKAETPLWQTILGLYLIFEVGNTMFSSKKDLEGMMVFIGTFLVLVLSITALVYFLKPDLLPSFWTYLSSINVNSVGNYFKTVNIYLLIPLILDLLIILITKPFRL